MPRKRFDGALPSFTDLRSRGALSSSLSRAAYTPPRAATSSKALAVDAARLPESYEVGRPRLGEPRPSRESAVKSDARAPKSDEVREERALDQSERRILNEVTLSQHVSRLRPKSGVLIGRTNQNPAF